MKKICIITILLILCITVNCFAAGVGEETNILSYDDAFDISEYPIPAMQYVMGAGIINGKTISKVNPEDNATRAEIAVILHRFVEKIRKSYKI